MADSPLPTAGPDVFAMHALLRQAYLRAGVPTMAHLDLTYRCDLDCAHCYLDDKTYPELTTTEWLDVLEQLAAAGVMTLTWSGGEVFLRPDFEALLERAHALGFVLRIKTHAGNVSAERAHKLASLRVSKVEVSVYSLVEAVHDAFVRRSGGLRNTLAGIKHLRAAQVPVRVGVSVVRENVTEIEALHEHFTRLGCDVEFNVNIFRDHSASPALDRLQLEGADRIEAERRIRRLKDPLPNRPVPIQERPGPEPCGAGRTLAYVSPDGGVWPCVNFPMELGNLRRQRFVDLWTTSPERQALAAWSNDDRTACHSCAGNAFCFYCPGEAYKLTGDFRSAPASFHARTRAKMLAYQDVTGDRLTADEWASVPDGGERPERPGKFVFPIYRPRKGQGARVVPDPAKRTER